MVVRRRAFPAAAAAARRWVAMAAALPAAAIIAGAAALAQSPPSSRQQSQQQQPQAQQQQQQQAQRQRPASLLWFDPTQLPAFTGTVERYLPNPRGEIDRLMFREGPQVVFPPDMAEGVRHAAPPGRPVTVWGIRARTAPVITMLAYSPDPAETAPTMVDRLYWRFAGAEPAAQGQAAPLAVSGTVKAPYYAPQGEVVGAILEDGTVVLLPTAGPDGGGATALAEPFRDLLRPGARLAAEGTGHVGEAGRALVASRLGDSPQALRPVQPPPPPQAATGQTPPPPPQAGPVPKRNPYPASQIQRLRNRHRLRIWR